MDLRQAGARFRAVYRTLDGRRFHGEILAPPTRQDATAFERPRRLLKVGAGAAVQAGTLFRTGTGRVYLCADNGDSDRERLLYRTFKLIEMDRQLPWQRRTAATDPVQGLARAGTPAALGPVYCTLEPVTRIADALRVPARQYRLITAAALQPGDRLGDYQVGTVETLLGVTVAEATTT